MLLARGCAELLDVKGAFLRGKFEDGETLYMEIPEGFEAYCPAAYIWMLLRTIWMSFEVSPGHVVKNFLSMA